MLAVRVLSVLVLSLAGSSVFAQAPAEGQAPAPRNPPVTMTLSTEAFPDGGQIPVRFSQAAEGALPGEGTSPALSWSNAPEGTQSFVLYMHDLEVARNRSMEDQLHWLVWNIPATETSLPEGIPRGETLENGAYQISATGPVYRGPGASAEGAPHHYVFELIAVDTVLDVEPGEDAFETRRALFSALEGHVLGKAAYVGVFRRPRSP